jgi:hypothetical protein
MHPKPEIPHQTQPIIFIPRGDNPANPRCLSDVADMPFIMLFIQPLSTGPDMKMACQGAISTKKTALGGQEPPEF